MCLALVGEAEPVSQGYFRGVGKVSNCEGAVRPWRERKGLSVLASFPIRARLTAPSLRAFKPRLTP